jgi:nitroreductase
VDEQLRRWREAALIRRSRRAYDPRAIDETALSAIESLCATYRPYPDARVALVREPPVNVFTGILGSYGSIKGAPSVLVFLARGSGSAARRQCGYTGEAIVLEATASGLSTCWVGGFFDPLKARRLLSKDAEEHIVAVSPLGHSLAADSATERVMAGLAGAHNRLALETIAPGSSQWPAWARSAAELVRIAPSATNRQPWRLSMDGDALVMAKDSRRDLPRVTKELDIGIASLHAEFGAAAHGVSGVWTDALQGSLEVCRFVPE